MDSTQQYLVTPYRPDGAFNLVQAIWLVVITFGVAILAGWVMHLVSSWVIYIILLYPTLAGLAIAFAGARAIDSMKFRNPAIAYAICGTASLLAMMSFYYFEFLSLHELIPKRYDFWWFLSNQGKIGFTWEDDRGGQTRIEGIIVYIILFMDIAAAMAVSLFGGKEASRPFCTHSNQWKEESEGRVHRCDAISLNQAIGSGNLSKAAGILEQEADSFAQLVLYSSPEMSSELGTVDVKVIRYLLWEKPDKPKPSGFVRFLNLLARIRYGLPAPQKIKTGPDGIPLKKEMRERVLGIYSYPMSAREGLYSIIQRSSASMDIQPGDRKCPNCAGIRAVGTTRCWNKECGDRTAFELCPRFEATPIPQQES